MTGRTSITVGVIGTGLMGAPMARRLLAAGYPTIVCNRTRASADQLVANGAVVVDGPVQVGQARAEVVLLSVPAGPDVSMVLDALLPTLPPGALIIDTSTIAPSDAVANHGRCDATGIAYVDAPVSGGPSAAETGTLSVMAGGESDDLERAETVMRAFAGRFVRCGGPGAGQVAKACNQLIVAATIEVVSEALVLARAAGADPALVREALLGGFAASRILDLHGGRMLARDFVPGGKARLQLKDIDIIRGLAHEVGVPLDGFEAAAARFERLVAAGGGELDHSALVTVLEADAGVRL